MLLSSEAEGNLVGLLNESIKEKNLSTRIVIYDHNWDNINYARDILSSDVGSDVYGMSWAIQKLWGRFFLILFQVQHFIVTEEITNLRIN